MTRANRTGRLGPFYTALAILLIFALYPRLGTGFATNDDSVIALVTKSSGHPIRYAWDFAVEQGRFSQMFLILGLTVPYLVDSAAYYYFICVGAIITNIVAFYLVMQRVFQSRHYAIFLTALSLAFLQYSWQHNPVTAYPFAYSAGLTFFLLALLTYARWQLSGTPRWGLVTAGLYFGALLTSEAFGPCCILFLCLALHSAAKSRRLRESIGTVYRLFMPIAAALFLYLALYFSFKLVYPGRYEGVQISTNSASRIGAVIWQYTKATLPAYFYFSDPATIAATSESFGMPSRGILDIWTNLRIEWLVKAFILFVLTTAILRCKETSVSWRMLKLLFPLGLISVFLPVSLLGVTTKYQDWVTQSHSLAYIQSYYAYFGTVFTIALLIIGVKTALARTSLALLAYAVVVAALLALASIATDSYNYSIARDQQLSDLKWRAVDQLAQTDELKAMPYGAVVYAPSLWEHRGIVANHPEYWSDYLTWRTGKKLNVVSTVEEFDHDHRQRQQTEAFFLSFQQEPKEPNQFIVLAKPPLSSLNGEPTYSTDLCLFSYSKNKKFVLIGRYQPGAPVAIYVNSEAVTDISGDTFIHQVDESLSPDRLAKTTIKSSVPVDAAHLTISYFQVGPKAPDFQVAYGQGFYGIEKNEQSSWNWSSGEAQLSVWNRTGRAAENCLTFDVVTLDSPRTVAMNVGTTRQLLTVPSGVNKVTVSIPLHLLQGENKIEFTTDLAGHEPGNGDPRSIAFGLQNVKLCRIAR